MSEQKPRSIVATVAWWIGVIVVAIVLYVLSAGPASRIVFQDALKNGGDSAYGRIYVTVYAPVIAVAFSNDTAFKWYEDYISWWCEVRVD
jgi:hypothetical protein